MALNVAAAMLSILPLASLAIAQDASPGTLISAATYAMIQHYTRYPFAYGPPNGQEAQCSTTPYDTVLVSNISVSATATEALIYRDDSLQEFVLSVPGSDSVGDAITDFNFEPFFAASPGVTSQNCNGCLVHSGFLVAWNSIADIVIDNLTTFGNQYPNYEVKIAGHSLGGAVGALGAFSLKALGFPLTQVFTFGQPRTGNQAWADAIDTMFGSSATQAGTLFRTTHYNDPVPQLPTQLMSGFVHSRSEYWESSADQFGAQYTYLCPEQESPGCNARYQQFSDVSAHLTYSGFTINSGDACS